MANSTLRQELIFSLQKKLFSLSRDQLQVIAFIIDDGPANNVDVLSVTELYNLIDDFIRSEKLSSLEDEGMTQLLLLDDLISDLLASNGGAAGNDPNSPLIRTHDASGSPATAAAAATPAESPTERENDPQKQQDPPAQDSADKKSRSGRSNGNFLSKPAGKIFIAASAVLGGIGAVALAPVVLGAVGFTSAGIAAGSFAASMMSAAAVANGGGVAAGSLVAILQSAGAVGLSAAASTAVAGVGAGVGAGIGATAGLLAGSTNNQEEVNKEDKENKDKEEKNDGENKDKEEKSEEEEKSEGENKKK
ncbi:interferon alpha-inducible protein 27-like protein 2B isoform X1 [Poecilia reticulata]|uniref:Interferon alpha-inducible protein 27-like protein 2B n=1 Tax=Poecilia reticulata TaxID=8081 RepID=A0A3P9QEP3_POERE|nr:PREDICTED: interferon alpha-inducible protein 27-like protein 2B isoform X1 [Poecilia reticulata]